MNVATRHKDSLTCQEMSRYCPTFCGLYRRPLFVGPLFGRTCWTCLNPALRKDTKRFWRTLQNSNTCFKNGLVSFTNCLTIGQHKQENMQYGAAFPPLRFWACRVFRRWHRRPAEWLETTSRRSRSSSTNVAAHNRERSQTSEPGSVVCAAQSM